MVAVALVFAGEREGKRWSAAARVGVGLGVLPTAAVPCTCMGWQRKIRKPYIPLHFWSAVDRLIKQHAPKAFVRDPVSIIDNVHLEKRVV